MINKELLNPLTSDELKDITDKVNICFGKYKKNNRIIKDDIFKILEMNSKTLYYPIKDDDICGFVYKFKSYMFSYINSYIPLEKQIFAAAHELYHVLYSEINNKDLISSGILNEDLPVNKIDKEDLKANRFAAELLVPDEVFRNEINIRNIKMNDIDMRTVVELMDVFLVPYKTLVRRLYEIQYISATQCKELLSVEDRKENSEVILWQKRLGLCKRNNERTNDIKLDSFIDNAIKLYDKQQITYEKLSYLLNFVKLNPNEFNIYEKVIQTPSEDEILKIMEE